jgi:hypothetical protein
MGTAFGRGVIAGAAALLLCGPAAAAKGGLAIQRCRRDPIW